MTSRAMRASFKTLPRMVHREEDDSLTPSMMVGGQRDLPEDEEEVRCAVPYHPVVDPDEVNPETVAKGFLQPSVRRDVVDLEYRFRRLHELQPD
ncbi:hypothetical protein KGO95_04445 [Patescibacteria group bacterium]|nr:hypothetical protein [Patescibacteria group bacterium]